MSKINQIHFILSIEQGHQWGKQGLYFKPYHLKIIRFEVNTPQRLIYRHVIPFSYEWFVDIVMMVTCNQTSALITVGVNTFPPNSTTIKPFRSSPRGMQLNVVVLGKSAILYLFGEPKLLIINPPCTQSLILPPMSSKNTSMCCSITFHSAVILHVTSTILQPQNRKCDHF